MTTFVRVLVGLTLIAATVVAVLVVSSFGGGHEAKVGLVRTVDSSSSTTRPTATTATVAASTTTAHSAGTVVSSTAYCLTGRMANGRRTFVGAVAGNRWPIGTRLRVSASPVGPGLFTVLDRHRPGATQLDFAVPGDCSTARSWGRRRVLVEVVAG